MLGACGLGAAPSASSPSASSTRSGLPATPPAPVSSDWVEYHRDALRAGVGPSEPALDNPAVAWRASVDADVYASPLIDSGHVIVATENNTVYSLDVFTGSVIWKKHLGDPVAASSLPCGDIGPVSGITGTPAIDPATERLFAVAYLQDHRHWLFALRLVDGSVLFQQVIDPAGSSPVVQQQRGALAIGSGRVYVPLGGLFGDCGSYHGYVVAVPVGGGTAVAYRVPSPREAGVWSAMGVTLDPAGDVYFVSGNGASTSTFDLSDSVIELSPDLQTVKSYFAPSNWVALSAGDTDLGALGATVLPSSGLVIAVGKDGVAYVMSAGQLGGVGGQKAKFALCGGAFGGTAWAGDTVYVPCTDGLYAISVTASPAGPVALSVRWRNAGARTASPILSAGAVWAIDPSTATLFALDPASGSVRYSTALGAAAHFSTPAATDGFVVAPAGHDVVAVSVVS
jgi:outer membrane protein assembly factor BamB